MISSPCSTTLSPTITPGQSWPGPTLSGNGVYHVKVNIRELRTIENGRQQEHGEIFRIVKGRKSGEAHSVLLLFAEAVAALDMVELDGNNMAVVSSHIMARAMCMALLPCFPDAMLPMCVVVPGLLDGSMVGAVRV